MSRNWKIVIVTSVISTALYSVAWAYDLTAHDTNLIWQLNQQVDQAIESTERSPVFMEKAAAKFSTLMDSLSADPRKKAIIKNVFEHTHNQLALVTDSTTRAFKQSFVDTYLPNLQGESFELRLTWCVQKFDMVNTIAKKYDVPTALVLATWFMESSCRMANPDNGNGLFQITSNYYAPGPIDDAELEKQITDFIMFSRGKWNWYHKSNPDRQLTITYKKWDIESLESQGALYNSVGSSINAWPLRATNQYYNWGNFSPEWKSSVKDGMITAFVRLLNWELQNR